MRIRIEVEAPDRPAVLALLRAVTDRFAEGEPESAGGDAVVVLTPGWKPWPGWKHAGDPPQSSAVLEIEQEGP